MGRFTLLVVGRFTLLLLVALESAVDADYIKMTSFLTTETCDGNPFMVTVVPGCAPYPTGSVQYQCTSTSGAIRSTYGSDDCSGTPTSSSDATQFTFGCAVDMETTCESGDYDLGSGVATYMYTQNQCPPTVAPQGINTIPCGTCFDFGNGNYQHYECNATSYTVTLHNAKDCSDNTGLSETSQLAGCTQTMVSVNNQVCTDSASDSGSSLSLNTDPRPPDAHQKKAKLEAGRSKMQDAQAKALASMMDLPRDHEQVEWGVLEMWMWGVTEDL